MITENIPRQFRWTTFLLIIVLVIGILSLDIYILQAYEVTNYVTVQTDGPEWSSSPSGSLFPFPHRPGQLQTPSKMNSIDRFFYFLFHGSTIMLFYMLIICLWVVTFMYSANFITKILPVNFSQWLSSKPSRRKSFLLSAVLISITLFLSLYSLLVISAASVGGWHKWIGDVHWITSPPGSFFPLPKASGNLELCSEMTLLDQIIFIVVIRTFLVFGVAIVGRIFTIRSIIRVIQSKNEYQPARM